MALLLLPVAVAVAVLRYRLYALDMIVSRALVYTTLIVMLGGAYVVAVGLLGLLFGEGTVVPFAGAVVIAWMFDPLRTALRRRVDRMLFGDRSTPYRALARLGERLESAVAPESRARRGGRGRRRCAASAVRRRRRHVHGEMSRRQPRLAPNGPADGVPAGASG